MKDIQQDLNATIGRISSEESKEKYKIFVYDLINIVFEYVLIATIIGVCLVGVGFLGYMYFTRWRFSGREERGRLRINEAYVES